MKLHYFPVSSYSQKVLMALHEKQLEFTPVIVNMSDRKAYLEINPFGKVPTLETDSGAFVFESSNIVEYLENHFDSGPRLLPADREAARQARFLERFSDLYVMDQMMTIFFDGQRPPEHRNAGAVERAKKTLDASFRYLDNHFRDHTWALGDTFSVADCSFAPALGYLRMVYPFEQYEHLTAYAERLSRRPSYLRVMEEAGPYISRMIGG